MPNDNEAPAHVTSPAGGDLLSSTVDELKLGARVAALEGQIEAYEARFSRLEDAAKEERSQQPTFGVSQVSKGEQDIEGRKVEEVYARKSGTYAVYRVKDGDVWVQLADDKAEADRQRAELGKVSVLRWDIDKLADGWKREAHYHHELAAGLQLALEGDTQGAADKLTRILDALRDEREVAGRIQYMGCAAASAAALLGLLYVFSERIHSFEAPATDVWLAGKAGLMGALFSVALAIRGRTVALDNDRLGNFMDGAVRLSIGVVAAGFLLLALGSGMLARVVAGDFQGTGPLPNWQSVVVLGFVAGFLERLVPDLLSKTQPTVAPQGAAQGAVAGQAKI